MLAGGVLVHVPALRRPVRVSPGHTLVLRPHTGQTAEVMIGDNRIPSNVSRAACNGVSSVACRASTVGMALLVIAFPCLPASGQLLDATEDSEHVLGMPPRGDSGIPDWPPYSLPLGSPPPGQDTPYGPDQDSVGIDSGPTQPACDPYGWAGGWQHGLFGLPPDRQGSLGEPLMFESWRYRPFSAGFFVGMLQGCALVDDWVGGNQGFFGGYRLGWDYHDYWGCEMRFGFGNVALYDSARAKAAQQEADDAKGLAADDPFRQRFDRHRDCTTFVWDVSLLYYPWGDSPWRPYLTAGLGTASVEFIDRLSTRYSETAFATPVAIGVKYRYNDWAALRFECADNIAFGNSFNTLHHVSLTGGVEVRFGGSRVAYWPWHPGRHYW